MLVVAVACSSKSTTAREDAVSACLSVRQSIAGKKLEPKRVYKLLDRAIDQAHDAGVKNGRYAGLERDIEKFERTLKAESSYTNAARFTVAAKDTKTACQTLVNVDIGIAG